MGVYRLTPKLTPLLDPVFSYLGKICASLGREPDLLSTAPRPSLVHRPALLGTSSLERLGV